MESKEGKESEVMLVHPKTEIKTELPEKRPLTASQQENLKRLIERNKAKALERKIEREKEPPKEPMLTKKKRPYKQDLERKIVADRLASLEELMKGLNTNFRMESNKTVQTVVPVKPKTKKPTKPKRPPTPITTDCDSETEAETETETEDECSKYVRKANQRIETVKKIQYQLQQPNRYSNMSIF